MFCFVLDLMAQYSEQFPGSPDVLSLYLPRIEFAMYGIQSLVSTLLAVGATSLYSQRADVGFSQLRSDPCVPDQSTDIKV